MTELPKGWAKVRTDEAGTLDLGRQRSPKYHSGPNMKPYLRVANVFEDRIDTSDVKTMHFDPEAFERSKLHVGDVLLNEGQSPEWLGRPAIYRGDPPDVAFTNSLIRFKPNAAVTSEWALAVFRHHMHSGRFARESRITTNIAHLSANRLAAVEFRVPPLAEQERIVTAIEEAFSTLDAGEAGLRTVRQLLKRMRDAILTAAVTGRLVPQDPTDTPAAKLLADLGVQPTEGENLPGGWAPAELGGLLEDIEAGKSFATQGRIAQAGEVGVIKVSAMTWGDFRPGENKALPPGTAIDERWMIRAGDLLLSRANTADYVGACVLVQRDHNDLILSDKSLRLRTAAGVDRRWLLYALRSRPAREQIERLATGTKESMRNISQAKLRSLRVSLPPAEEQIRIADEVERQMSFVEACERAVDVGLASSGGLRRSVLKAAFEGRLVPQDPSDEPASVLLDRIRTERAAQPAPKRRARRTA